MGSTQSFLFFTNRAVRQFTAALEPLSGCLFDAGHDPAADIELLYFDTYGGKRPPAVDPSCLSLIPRQRTMALDNKEAMARALLVAGQNFPRVFFAATDVPDETTGLWYVKSPLSSAGKGIQVMTREALLRQQPDKVVIQEAVQDLDLIDGRKYTLRLYVLVNRGQVYLYGDGFVIVHAAQYQPDSCDPAVQFVHAGYMRADSGVCLQGVSRLPGSAKILDSAASTVTSVYKVFSDRLKYEKAQHFCLFGIDLLVRRDLSTVLIEINDRPNLVHTDTINTQINIPMLRAMATTLNPAWAHATPSQAAGSRQFLHLAAL